MSNQNVETSSGTLDKVLVTLAALCVIAGVLAFSLLTEQALAVRLGALGRQSWEELRRVVWPTRKETLNTTGLVMAFVVVISLFMFICDQIIEWGLYDVLLRMKI
jgi:preprotein translocase subunit SecE